jgi:hypothetical protein
MRVTHAGNANVFSLGHSIAWLTAEVNMNIIIHG